MKAKHILTSYWFILSLSLLLLNDLVFKNMFHNWVSGKASDFAGLLAFPLFWMAFFPSKRNWIFIGTAVAFAFWKSPASQFLIDGWNGLEILPLHRVVDATDLMALLILPLGYRIAGRGAELAMVPVPAVAPALIASFAFVATSYKTDVPLKGSHTFPFSRDTLEARWVRLDESSRGETPDPSDKFRGYMDAFVRSDFCGGGFELTFDITEVDSNTVTIDLIYAFHNCPRGDSDSMEIMKILGELRDRLMEGSGNTSN